MHKQYTHYFLFSKFISILNIFFFSIFTTGCNKLSVIDGMKQNNPKSLKHLSKSALHKEVDNEKDNISLLRSAVKNDLGILLTNALSDISVIYTKDEYDCTMLHYAAKIGALEIIKFLLEHGANIDAKDNEGNTPIHFATQNRHIEAVALLLTKGANSNAKDNEGNAPIHFATQNRHVETVALLLTSVLDLFI